MTTPSLRHIAFASFIGTAIEFYDFYIYAMAAALVIGQVFFPASDPAAQSLNALLTFGLAFIARPLGAVWFGHYGDKVGRKSTLAASLLVMGGATLLIGLLPGYAQLGVWAPVLLCLLRFAQGIGLGGRVGRRGIAGDRICTRRAAWLVWHVPATGAVGGFSAGDAHLPGLVADPD